MRKHHKPERCIRTIGPLPLKLRKSKMRIENPSAQWKRQFRKSSLKNISASLTCFRKKLRKTAMKTFIFSHLQVTRRT